MKICCRHSFNKKLRTKLARVKVICIFRCLCCEFCVCNFHLHHTIKPWWFFSKYVKAAEFTCSFFILQFNFTNISFPNVRLINLNFIENKWKEYWLIAAGKINVKGTRYCSFDVLENLISPRKHWTKNDLLAVKEFLFKLAILYSRFVTS